MKVFTLKKRKDFIRAAQEFKVVTNGLVLQAALSFSDSDEPCCFVGYTATKKIGKAFLRNRTKRRLRAAAALVFKDIGRNGVTYVLIGRHNTAKLDFSYLVKRLREAVLNINGQLFPQGDSHDQKTDDSLD